MVIAPIKNAASPKNGLVTFCCSLFKDCLYHYACPLTPILALRGSIIDLDTTNRVPASFIVGNPSTSIVSKR